MTLYPHSGGEDLLHASAMVCGKLTNYLLRCSGTVQIVRSEYEGEMGQCTKHPGHRVESICVHSSMPFEGMFGSRRHVCTHECIHLQPLSTMNQ